MIRRFLLGILAFAAPAAAQQPQQQTPAANAAVSGVVKDFGTGQPLANYNVSTYVDVTWIGDTLVVGQGKQVKSVTDDKGRYRISDLPPGPYRIDCRNAESFGSSMTKHVTMSGQDIDGIDFLVKVNGAISGKVLDENKEPVPNVGVNLVSREYYSGVLGYFFKSYATTNDRGEYTLNRVEAGHPYLVMADKAIANRMPAYSEAPLDPHLRRRVPIRTYYPSSPTKEGAALVTIRPGEHREGVDIEMKKTQNYCISGTTSGLGGPSGLNVGIEAMQPAYGQSSTGGMFGPTPGTLTGPDGKFRICDLNPGGYRLSAFDRYAGGPNAPHTNYALVNVSILDQDLAGLNLVISPGMELQGEVILDGPAPVEPIKTKVNISINPLLRAGLPGERPGATAEIPGTFTLSALLPADYGGLRAFIRAPGCYTKDARLGSASVLYDPIHLGEAQSGATLRITIGRDGATLSATVARTNGQPVPDIQVLAFPAEVTSEAMLQATLKTGQTNQLGQYKSSTLPPGKYYVAAVEDSFDATPESIGRLWRARNRFQEIELAPNGTATVQLEPIKIE